MKKLLSFILLVVLLFGVSLASWDSSKTIPLWFTVPNPSTDTLLNGTPIDPDSIFSTIYDSSSTTIRRDREQMINWNGYPGEYYIDFDPPDDSTAIYSQRIEIYYPGFNSVFVMMRVINIANYFDVNKDTSFVDKLILDSLNNRMPALAAPENFSSGYWTSLAQTVFQTIPADFKDSTGSFGQLMYLSMIFQQLCDSCKVYTAYSSDIDYLYFCDQLGDTVITISTRHMGKSSGGLPDTTKSNINIPE